MEVLSIFVNWITTPYKINKQGVACKITSVFFLALQGNHDKHLHILLICKTLMLKILERIFDETKMGIIPLLDTSEMKKKIVYLKAKVFTKRIKQSQR